jgi:hypothetical protein
MYSKLFISAIFLTSLAGCEFSSSSTEKQQLTLNYDFSETSQNFLIDTADHSVEHPSNDQIIAQMDTLPSPYAYRNGIKFGWNNYSDDIKGFIKQKITNLSANKTFQVDFQVDVLTFMSENCAGIGGNPGQAVKVKASLLNEEPIKIIEKTEYLDHVTEQYVISIDDGQSGGDDVTVMGHIGLPIACDDAFFMNPLVWEIKPLTNDEVFTFTSDASGEAWVYVSIDSGFEGISEFYLTNVELNILEL